jgi:iron complex transport system substrate-binding protein
VSPSIGMEMLNLGLVDIIKNFEQVASELGADLSASLVTDARKAFDATTKADEAIAAKPDLTVVGISGADKVCITNGHQAPDLGYWKSLGAELVDHGGMPTDYFTEISYEQLDE